MEGILAMEEEHAIDLVIYWRNLVRDRGRRRKLLDSHATRKPLREDITTMDPSDSSLLFPLSYMLLGKF